MAEGLQPPATEGNDYQCVGEIVADGADMTAVEPYLFAAEQKLQVLTREFHCSSFLVWGRNSPPRDADCTWRSSFLSFFKVLFVLSLGEEGGGYKEGIVALGGKSFAGPFQIAK